MTTTSGPIPAVGHRPILTEVPPLSRAYVTDFFEARRRMLTESEGTTENSEMDRQVQEPVSRRKGPLDLAEVFEQECYWLIPAAVLMGLALGMFGL